MPPFFWASGIQQDLPESALLRWTECFRETYDESGTLVSDALADCDGEFLMLACRPVGNANLSLAAMASRDQVLRSCEGDETSCSHPANGVGWYYLSSYSWGFAPAGARVNLDTCDYDGTEEPPASAPTEFAEPAGGEVEPLKSPELRLCWHLSGGGESPDELSDGFRCGHNDLNSAADWERLIYSTD